MNFLKSIFGRFKALSLPQYAEQLATGGGSPSTVQDPYSKVDAVFACVMAKWTALDSIPWLLFDKAGNQIESGSAWQLLQSPHPQVTRTQFLAWLVISLDIRGKAFFWIEADDKMQPVALWPLIPQNMTPYFKVHPETGTKLLDFWRYSSPSGKQVNFLPEELLTFRYPHPSNWWDGLPRIGPASLAVSQYHSATEFQARSFANDGMISGLLTSKTPLTEEQMKASRESWTANYAGSRNAKKTAVLGSDWSYTRLALTPQELDYLESNKFSLQRICMALGVPPAVLGLQGDSQLGAGKENEGHTLTFWRNTMLPLMSLTESSMNQQLFQNPTWRWSNGSTSSRRCSCLGFTSRALGRASRNSSAGQSMIFDRDQISVLMEERNRLLESVNRLWSMGVPLADASDYYDLGIPARPWHSTGFLPFSVAPADQVISPDLVPPIAPAASADPFQAIEKILGGTGGPACVAKSDAREANWQRHNANLNKFAKRLKMVFRSHYVRQRIEMLRKIDSQKTIKSGLIMELLFDLTTENAKLKASLKPIVNGVIQQSGQQQYSELGNSNTYQVGARAESWLNKLLKNAEKVNETNRSALQNLLEENIADNQITNSDQLAEAIREFYRGRESGGAAQAGETTAVGAYNSARTDAQEQLGITQQEWLSARDNRVRPSHEEADGQIVDIGEPFQVGEEELMFPGDPDGSIEEVINCRCVAIPITEAA